MAVELEIADDPVARAAERVVAAAREVLGRSPEARLAVAGGSAGAALGRIRAGLGSDWRRVALTWVDERAVPFADPESSRGAAHRSGALDDADPPAVELPLYLDGEDPDGAARRVEAAIGARFGGALDLLLLGMGPDGHVASVFPGRPVPEGRVYVVRDSPKPPPVRITLAPPLLCTAGCAVLLATGAAKVPALRRVLAGDPELAVTSLPELVIVTDRPELAD